MTKMDSDRLKRVVQQVVENKTKDSVVLDVKAEEQLPKFDLSEFTLGRVLGRGGFCVVNEITKIDLKPTNDKDEKPSSAEQEDGPSVRRERGSFLQNRSFMQANCLRDGKDCRYAIKMIQESVLKGDQQVFLRGAVDLALEARFLSVIRHPSIVKMRGMGTGSPYDGEKFFLVLDRLYDTLPQRLIKWKKKLPNKMSRMVDPGGKREAAFWVERLTAAYHLAGALNYMHGLRILYRDVKPENVAFDVRDDLKIFDLGLAKEIDPSTRREDGTYLLTGDTGSPLFMAPEVFLKKPYNETCDVYSFCILAWQILKCERPFKEYNMKMFKRMVVERGARPRPDAKWPEELCDALRLGWNVDLHERPSMEEMSEIFRGLIDEASPDGGKLEEEILNNSFHHSVSLSAQKKK